MRHWEARTRLGRESRGDRYEGIMVFVVFSQQGQHGVVPNIISHSHSSIFGMKIMETKKNTLSPYVQNPTNNIAFTSI